MSAISENLERHLQSFISNDQPLAFFKGLSRYIDYSCSQPTLDTAIAAQMAERDTKNAQIVRLEEKAVTEMREAKIKLLTVIEKTGIDTNSFTRFRLYGGSANIIEELAAFERGDYRKSGWYSDNLQHYLFDIAANLRAAGYEKEISEFIVSPDKYDTYWQRIDGPGHYTIFGDERNAFIFSQAWPERFELEALVKKECELKPWGDFETLLQFKQAYDAISENGSFSTILKDEDIHTPLDAGDRAVVALMAEDLQIFMGDGSSTYRHRYSHTPNRIHYLDVNTFKTRTQAVHNRLMQVAEGSDTKTVKNSETGHPTKELSAADKKRLFILEQLKEEWDLVPKRKSGPMMVHGVFAYETRAYEKRISAEKLVLWKQGCGIDHHDLEAILQSFQDDDLLENFEFINPYR